MPKSSIVATPPTAPWPARSVRLTSALFSRGLTELARRDEDLAAVLAAIGAPPMWARPPGFGTLVHILLEQQVSLASAQAAYDKLLALGRPLTPERFLTYTDAELHAAGFSQQKARYGRELALALGAGRLQLHRMSRLDDDQIRAALVTVKGIGPWTAEIYLLMVLRRADAWPVGDLALAQAAHTVERLASLPKPAELETLGAAWRPWRAVAARVLWHHYLTQRRRGVSAGPPVAQ